MKKYLIYEKTAACPACKCKWENDFDAGRVALALDSDEDCLCCPDCGALVVNREDVELDVVERLQDLFEQVYGNQPFAEECVKMLTDDESIHMLLDSLNAIINEYFVGVSIITASLHNEAKSLYSELEALKRGYYEDK